MKVLLAIAWLVLVAPAQAYEGKPKLGPDAVPMTQSLDYLRKSPAPDYWKLAQFYVPQATGSACSVASVTMAMNFVRGVPPGSEDMLVTQAGLLEAVADPDWTAKGAEGGDGVLFPELVKGVRESLAAYKLDGAEIELFEPKDDSPATLARLRALLAGNEASDRDVALVYFNQGVLTGDWDGPHVSPIGAYDAVTGRVLMMDVDRDYYVPYWSADEKLLQAMLKPAPADQGVLAGATGGLVLIRAASPGN
ncbi:MAG: phytochelatin synthase family protein [Geminicoccaceae bacterium]